jgi:hypothetical protein
MSKKSKVRSITTPRQRPEIRRVNVLSSGMLKILLMAALAVGASIYGVVRHLSHPFKSMIVPAPSAEPEMEILLDEDGGIGE